MSWHRGFDNGGGERRWRHIDMGMATCELVADAPRVSCPAHGPTVAEVASGPTFGCEASNAGFGAIDGSCPRRAGERLRKGDRSTSGSPVDAALRHGPRHGFGEAAAIGQFGQQGGACMAHQILPVGGHPHRLGGATIVHLQGALLGCVECSFNDSHSRS